MPGEIDETRLRQYMGRMIGYMTGGALCFAMWLGDELGLYRALADGGAQSADDVAAGTDCNPRLVREWLDRQVAGGLVEYDRDSDRYELSPEGTAALADDLSPVFVARGMNGLISLGVDHDRIAAAFRGDGAMGWGEHHPRLFSGTEWVFRTGYRSHLPGSWLPALDAHRRLQDGAAIADVGCGHGASAVVMAQAYPSCSVTGFDSHGPSIDTARQRAHAAGVDDRVTFEVADAKGYPGTFELICFFDCLHDMGDPLGVARHAREHLESDGTVLLVEPFSLDDKGSNLSDNPMAALFYTMSSAVCTPNSLSQDVALGLGAQAGEERLRSIFEEAGFSRFRRATETTMNLVLEARP